MLRKLPINPTVGPTAATGGALAGQSTLRRFIKHIDRYDFYEESRHAFAVVMTGETAKYGNILLAKGVTPSS